MRPPRPTSACSRATVGGARGVRHLRRHAWTRCPARAGCRFASACFEKVGDGEFERVSAKGLGVWRKSRPDASAFRWEQRDRGPDARAPSTAWSCATAGTTTRASRSSRRGGGRVQLPPAGGGLPNLRVAAIDIEPGEVEGTAVYKVKIVNRGTAAGAERRRPAARRRRGRGRGRGDRGARAERDSNGHLQRTGLPSPACASSSIRKS